MNHVDRTTEARKPRKSNDVEAARPGRPATGAALREWCESRAHPRGRLADGECFCGLIRYDD
jgi:hypothetical protein